MINNMGRELGFSQPSDSKTIEAKAALKAYPRPIVSRRLIFACFPVMPHYRPGSCPLSQRWNHGCRCPKRAAGPRRKVNWCWNTTCRPAKSTAKGSRKREMSETALRAANVDLMVAQ
jgi:hypothetical protein